LSRGICISEILDWSIGILFMVMFAEVSSDIGIRLDEEEKYQHRHCEVIPKTSRANMPILQKMMERCIGMMRQYGVNNCSLTYPESFGLLCR
jgi:hypothetical protein